MKFNKIKIGVLVIVAVTIVTTAITVPTMAVKLNNAKINQNGQTYGTLDLAEFDNAPDLLQAVGVDGNTGYVYRIDLFGEMPKTPEEALRLQAERDARGSYTIPLYANDGKTIIGEFLMEPGTSSNDPGFKDIPYSD